MGETRRYMDTYNYTENNQNAYDRAVEKLLYCREDLEQALQDYRQAYPSERPSREKDLKDRCIACGQDMEEVLRDPSVLQWVPTRAERMDELLEMFHDLCMSTPSSTDYLKRMIVRLKKDCWREDAPLRVSLLKVFLQGCAPDCKTFPTRWIWDWMEQRVPAEERKALAALPENERQAQLLAVLDDTVFQAVDEKAVSKAGSALAAEDILDLIVLQFPKCKKKLAEGSEDWKQMQDLVLDKKVQAQLAPVLAAYGIQEPSVLKQLDALRGAARQTPPADPDAFAALVGALEKQLQKQLAPLHCVDNNGREKSLWQIYHDAKKSKRKNDKKKAVRALPEGTWNLLCLCSNLAEGIFQSNGRTRKQLYALAFVFGLQLSTGDASADKTRDLEKVLFQEYYGDNLLRSITSADNTVAEPTGEGINYKNYAEAIYLYYLVHPELYQTPGEGIDKAESMIDRCTKEAARRAKEDPNRLCQKRDPASETVIYRNIFVNTLRGLPESGLAEYILDNYLVLHDAKTPRIMVNDEERAAKEQLRQVLEEHTENAYWEAVAAEYAGQEMAEPERPPRTLKERLLAEPEEEETGDELDEELFDENDWFRWPLRQKLREKYPDDAAFLRVLDQLDARLHSKAVYYSKAARERALLVLYTLLHLSSATAPLSPKKIRAEVKKQIVGGKVSTRQITDSLAVLQDIGCPIARMDVLRCSLPLRKFGQFTEAEQQAIVTAIELAEKKTRNAMVQAVTLLQPLELESVCAMLQSDCSGLEKKTADKLVRRLRLAHYETFSGEDAKRVENVLQQIQAQTVQPAQATAVERKLEKLLDDKNPRKKALLEDCHELLQSEKPEDEIRAEVEIWLKNELPGGEKLRPQLLALLQTKILAEETLDKIWNEMQPLQAELNTVRAALEEEGLASKFGEQLVKGVRNRQYQQLAHTMEAMGYTVYWQNETSPVGQKPHGQEQDAAKWNALHAQVAKMGLKVTLSTGYVLTEPDNRQEPQSDLEKLLDALRPNEFNRDRIVEGKWMLDGFFRKMLVDDLLVRKPITRTQLIAAHFNGYIRDRADIRRSDAPSQNEAFGEAFDALYKDYCMEVNYHLEEARYQEISTKNIVDLYILVELFYYRAQNPVA